MNSKAFYDFARGLDKKSTIEEVVRVRPKKSLKLSDEMRIKAKVNRILKISNSKSAKKELFWVMLEELESMEGKKNFVYYEACLIIDALEMK